MIPKCKLRNLLTRDYDSSVNTSKDQPGGDVSLRHQKRHGQTEANMASSVHLDHSSTDGYQQSCFLERSGVFSGLVGGGKPSIPKMCASPLERVIHNRSLTKEETGLQVDTGDCQAGYPDGYHGKHQDDCHKDC